MKRLSGWTATAGFVAVCALASQAAELVPAPPDRIEKIRGLADRWESGELSAAEKDDLIRSFIVESLRAGTLTPAGPPHSPATAPASALSGNKVIAVYPDRNTTQLVIEARQPLVAGSLVFVGPKELQVTLDDVLARSGDLYYYSASTPGKARIDVNDPVVTQQTRKIETPSALTLKIQETYTFEQKRLGEITAVQDGRAMIDRGTLHEVRERDIYKVTDSSGRYKGFLEIRGIGDLQSSGVLYNRMEDRRRLALQTVPGDRTEFVGQRKLMGLGVQFGISPQGREEFGFYEKTLGGGLAWNLTFKNGWGFDILFGAYQRKMNSGREDAPPGDYTREDLNWRVLYIAPFAVKKNFFFPAVASPFILAGGSVVDASMVYRYYRKRTTAPGIPGFEINEIHSSGASTFAPFLGAGVDFFPARLIRPRLDLRWQSGPSMRAAHKTVNTETTLLSLSVFSAW